MNIINQLIESISTVLTEAKSGESYNDEHAHANVWNHMVSKGIAHDKDAMHAELDKASKDKKHPLHFSNASDEGFTGGKKNEAAKESYHAEHKNAVDTIHALSQHPHFAKAIKEKHVAKVMGASKGVVSDTWKKYGATKGGTSKADVSIIHPTDKKHQGLKLSMKKGGGSQLMSSGPEENKAVHDVATKRMLDEHPKYSKLPKAKKDSLHKEIMKHMDTVEKHVNAMKTTPREKWEHHKQEAQKAMNAAHDAHPELNQYVRREATTGEGKFGEGSEHSASYLVKSSQGKAKASVKHASETDFNGSRPRVALPKGEGRSGNIKLDEK